MILLTMYSNPNYFGGYKITAEDGPSALAEIEQSPPGCAAECNDAGNGWL